MASVREDDVLWNGEQGAGGISWVDRSRMGFLRGVIDAGDATGRRNAYMHALHVNALQHELTAAEPLRNVLDFGCGTGRFIRVLSKHAAGVFAADKEPSMVEAARRYAGAYANQIVCCDPARLPFDSSSFDFTLCSSVLCVTMSWLLPDIVTELGRVTSAGGTLLLLEQVSVKRNLSLSRYHRALSNAGFAIVRSYPIRSGSSLLTNWVAHSGWIPVSAFPTIAGAELLLTARALMVRRSEYTEYAIAAKKL